MPTSPRHTAAADPTARTAITTLTTVQPLHPPLRGWGVLMLLVTALVLLAETLALAGAVHALHLKAPTPRRTIT